MDDAQLMEFTKVLDARKPELANRVRALGENPYDVCESWGIKGNHINIWMSHDPEVRALFDGAQTRKEMQISKRKARTRYEIRDDALAAIDSVNLVQSLVGIVKAAQRAMVAVIERETHENVMLNESFKNAATITLKVADSGIVRDILKASKAEEQTLDGTPDTKKDEESLRREIAVTQAMIEEQERNVAAKRREIADRQGIHDGP
jgi:hypothetical protein